MSYFGNLGKFSMLFFPLFFRLAQAREKIKEKNQGKNPGAQKFDAKNSATDSISVLILVHNQRGKKLINQSLETNLPH